MRPGMALALVCCSMLQTVSVSAAEQTRAFVPQAMADLAKGKAPSIAAAGGMLNVAFLNDGSIYCSSSDAGKKWTAPVKVSGSTLGCVHPVIAVGGDSSVNIVWQARETNAKQPGVFYSRSTDGGKTFSSAVDISGTKTESTEPQIAVGPDNSLHVVWIDKQPAPGGPDVFYASSIDGGKTWSKSEDVSNTPGGVSSNPAVAMGSDGRIHIAWSDTSSGEEQPDVFYAWKTAGKPWSSPEDLSKDSGFSELPHIACGQRGRVYFVWTDSSKKMGGDILCVQENADGKFSKPTNISDSTGISSQPAIAVDNEDRSALVWIDTTANKSIPDIWMKIGTGGSFSHKEKIFHSEVQSLQPSVTVSKGEAFVVWEESQGSSSTIKGCSVKLK